MSAPLTEEMVRIMRAIERDAFTVNGSGRYCIVGEPRPDRRTRELLVKRGLIDWKWVSDGPSGGRVLWSSSGRTVWFVTDKGRAQLAEFGGSSGRAYEPGASAHETHPDGAQRQTTTDTGEAADSPDSPRAAASPTPCDNCHDERLVDVNGVWETCCMCGDHQ